MHDVEQGHRDIVAFTEEALAHSTITEMDDGQWVGVVPGLPGVIAFAADERRCTIELASVIEDWARLGVQLRHPIPVIGTVDLNTPQAHGLLDY